MRSAIFHVARPRQPWRARGRALYAYGVLRRVLIDGVVSAEVVAAIEGFATAKGKPLEVSLLEPGADLKSSGLRGVAKRAECLLAVREAEQVKGAELAALQFDDEAELPLLIAARVAGNLEPALAFYLKQRHAIDLNAVVNASAERIDFQGTAWRALTGAELANLSGVLVHLTVEGFVTLRADGGVAAVTVSEPTQDETTEARNFVASLVHHGQISTHRPGQRARGTHEITTDAQGQRRLVRVRAGAR
ncbi:MAG TPA: hypothetical protein VFN67_10785 [Polyangiales bacterium]|nr:hypothetical protein [Polyangiales bacterium]